MIDAKNEQSHRIVLANPPKVQEISSSEDESEDGSEQKPVKKSKKLKKSKKQKSESGQSKNE